MLNNEAGQNYVVPACRLWGIPRPRSRPGLLLLCACCSEGAEGWAKWGWALNMKMELIYPHPKVDYNPFGHAFLCLGLTTKRGAFYSSWKLVFLLLPGGIWDVLCCSLFFFSWWSRSFQYSALRHNVSIILLMFGQFIVCFLGVMHVQEWVMVAIKMQSGVSSANSRQNVIIVQWLCHFGNSSCLTIIIVTFE